MKAEEIQQKAEEALYKSLSAAHRGDDSEFIKNIAEAMRSLVIQVLDEAEQKALGHHTGCTCGDLIAASVRSLKDEIQEK